MEQTELTITPVSTIVFYDGTMLEHLYYVGGSNELEEKMRIGGAMLLQAGTEKQYFICNSNMKLMEVKEEMSSDTYMTYITNLFQQLAIQKAQAQAAREEAQKQMEYQIWNIENLEKDLAG